MLSSGWGLGGFKFWFGTGWRLLGFQLTLISDTVSIISIHYLYLPLRYSNM